MLYFNANAFIVTAPVKASDVKIPIGKTGKTISLQELSTISEKQFEIIAGKKLGFADKLMFKAAQRKIKNSINSDGTINNKKIEKFYRRNHDKPEHYFNLGGFALGLFLLAIGVLIAYLIKDDKQRSRITLAWIGFGVFAFIYLLLVILVVSAGGW